MVIMMKIIFNYKNNDNIDNGRISNENNSSSNNGNLHTE